MAVTNVSEALAEDEPQVESHLHPVGSFRVEDHPIPTGREEVWRFTPLRRLRGLHRDTPFVEGGISTQVSAAEGVTVDTAASSDVARADGPMMK